jgi:hypothetical protein
MMQVLTFPAFRNNGIPVQLTDILAVIPENGLAWSILEFNGIGEAPDNLSMDEFEELVRKRPAGFMMSWNELKKFSDGLYQTIDCTIIGAKTDQDILCAHKVGDDFSSYEVFLNAFDSTEWSVWARDSKLMGSFCCAWKDYT